VIYGIKCDQNKKYITRLTNGANLMEIHTAALIHAPDKQWATKTHTQCHKVPCMTGPRKRYEGCGLTPSISSWYEGGEVYLFGMMVSNLAHEPTIFRAMAWEDLFSMRFAITHYRV